MEKPTDVPDVDVPSVLLQALSDLDEAGRRMAVCIVSLMLLISIECTLAGRFVYIVFTMNLESMEYNALCMGLMVSQVIAYTILYYILTYVGKMRSGISTRSISNDCRVQAVINSRTAVAAYRLRRYIYLNRGEGWFHIAGRIDEERQAVQGVVDAVCVALVENGPLGTTPS